MKFLKFLANLLAFSAVLLGIAGVGAAGGAVWIASEFERAQNFDHPVTTTIKRGSNMRSVANQLLELGVIDDDLDADIFYYAARFTGQANKIKAGEYEIPPKASMKNILDLLESGKVIQRNVTLREGLTSFEVLRTLSNNAELTQGDIDLPAEGSLLPETYSFAKGEGAADIIARMQTAMTKALDTAWENRAKNLPIQTKEEARILASIIEKETAVPSERKRVAGVFINRLRKGMLLQTDPTVIYAINGGKHEDNGKGPLGRRLLRKDLSIDNPYNTYKYAGLPPGPICNPGKDSIEAALNPEAHDYLYFVADGTGGHAFGKSLAEHNRNVAKWRKIRKNQ